MAAAHSLSVYMLASRPTDIRSQFGHLADQANGAGVLLASYTHDERGAPVSVQVGSDADTAPRYYYVYDARGDVVNLTDASGAVVATYAYDTWGNLTTSSESIPNAHSWVNPFRFDGREGVRYDGSDGLYWMSVRAYDPTIGRFLSRDPLGRAPLFFADNPYVYAGNNPLSNVDPGGQYRAAGHGAQTQVESWTQTKRHFARIVQQSGCNAACQAQIHAEWVSYHVGLAKGIASDAATYFGNRAKTGTGLGVVSLFPLVGTPTVASILKWLETNAAADGLSIVFYTLAFGVALYDIYALYLQHMFQQEASAGGGFWLTPMGLTGDESAMSSAGGVFVLVSLAFSAAMLVMRPEMWPIWTTFAALTHVALSSLEVMAEQYINQEAQVFGYSDVP